VAPFDDYTHHRASRHVQAVADWAYNNGFDTFLGAYMVRLGVESFIAAWEHHGRPTYFCLYQAANRIFYDFVTIFSENRSLTTGSTKDGQFLPKPPGHYVQTFSSVSVAELYDRHRSAEQYLTMVGGITSRPLVSSFQETLAGAVKEQAAYIQSLGLWPLRAPVWYFIRKHRLHNKTIEQLHMARKAVLPHDPDFVEFVASP